MNARNLLISATTIASAISLSACSDASPNGEKGDEESLGVLTQAQHTATDPGGGGPVRCTTKPSCPPGYVAFKYSGYTQSGAPYCSWACCDNSGGGGCDM